MESAVLIIYIPQRCTAVHVNSFAGQSHVVFRMSPAADDGCELVSLPSAAVAIYAPSRVNY